MTASVRKPRLAALDGLRLIAALAVAGYHYTTAWRIDETSPPITFLPTTVHVTVYGFLGVEFFFLISGFVICMSAWGRTLGEFFTSRISRLYPAYWVAVVITAVVAVVWGMDTIAASGRPTFLQVLVNLTMLQEPMGVSGVDGVYWTLFVELRFYLLMALLLRGGYTYRKMAIFCCVWMTVAVLGPRLLNEQLNELFITDYAPYFIAGITMYLIRRFGATPLLYGIVGFAWIVSLQRVNERMADMHPGFPAPAWPAMVIITGSYLVLLLVALGRTDKITWRWLPVAGALTYPFYLLHQRIGYTIIRAGYYHTSLPVWVLIVGTIVLVLGLAWLVHRYLERRGSSLLKAAMRRGVAALNDERTPVAAPVATARNERLIDVDQATHAEPSVHVVAGQRKTSTEKRPRRPARSPQAPAAPPGHPPIG
jgi:peptidoglycan/LPS O-acetylase OafA/YrhL